MTSKWRSTETFATKNTTTQMNEPKIENFANMPLFDVLTPLHIDYENSRSNPFISSRKDGIINENRSRNGEEKREKIIEGAEFNISGNDYFHKHNKFKSFKSLYKIKEVTKKILSLLSNPIEQADSMIETMIYDILMMILQLNTSACKTDLTKKTLDAGSKAQTSFFWASNNISMLFNKKKAGFTTMKNDDMFHGGDNIDWTKIFAKYNESFENGQEQFDNFILDDGMEGFSLQDQPKIIETIDSFQKNHPDFMPIDKKDIKAKVGSYYIRSLNAYETKLHRRITDEELFLFNNDFDNLLNDPEIQNKILNIVDITEWTTTTHSFYDINSEKDYLKYYKSYARFKIKSTTKLAYYPFNSLYFVLPTNGKPNDKNKKPNITDFTKLLSDAEMANKMLTNSIILQKYKDFKFSYGILPPTKMEKKTPNKNYVFSIDLTTTITGTIESYLDYVIKYFSYVVFSYKRLNNQFGFQEIEARVGTAYTRLLNYVEFQNYSIYKKYLDEYQLAIFNHIFFILIRQTDIDKTYTTDTAYNNKTYDKFNTFDIIQEFKKKPFGDARASVLKALQTTKAKINKITNIATNTRTNKVTNTDYVLITTTNSNKVDYSYAFSSIINEINKRYSKIAENTKFLPDIDISLFSSSVNLDDQGKDIKNQNTNYNTSSSLYDSYYSQSIPNSKIINPYTSTSNNDNITVLSEFICGQTFVIDKDMIKYYLPGKLSACEQLKRTVKKEFLGYAKTIKREIYNLILIPVVLYTVYNIYYMFFFKDSSTPVYNDGIYITKSGGCRNPIFPDWESYFHSYEKHNTDLFFEYIFKPSKIFYTWLNTIKAFLRNWKIGDNHLVYSAPYLWLFFSFYMFYYIWKKYGSRIFRFFKNFLKNPTLFSLKIGKKSKTKTSMGEFIFYIFFGLSILKDVFGFPWHSFLQMRLVPTYEDLGKPWGLWLFESPSIPIIVIKCILFILYWVFKYFISISLIPLSFTILTIYIIYTVFFAIYNNIDDETSYSSKVELIDRIIYTKLYNTKPNHTYFNDYFKYYIKTACWIIMIFMTEILLLYVLLNGRKNINKTLTGRFANNIKMFLNILYAVAFAFLIFWCFCKYKLKIPKLKTFYSYMKDETPPDINNPKYKNKEFLYKYDLSIYEKIKVAIDKRFTFDNPNIETGNYCEDNYEKLSKNNPFNILLSSDGLNAQIIKDEYEAQQEKIKNNKKPSFIAKWSDKIIGKMGNFGDKMLQRGQTYMADISKKTDNDEENGLSISNFTSNLKNTFDSVKNKILNDENKELLKETSENVQIPFVNDIVRMGTNFLNLKK
jgi:hypothetical protein